MNRAPTSGLPESAAPAAGPQASAAGHPAPPILPGSTLGVIGAGQLGLMFGLKARALGYRLAFLSETADAPARGMADEFIVAGPQDLEAHRAFARRCALITYESENTDAAPLEILEREGCRVYPPTPVLRIAQDRLLEKTFVRASGFQTADFLPVGSLEDLKRAVAALGLPGFLKTTRGGYDGKGQVRLTENSSLEAAFAPFAGRPCIFERQVDFVQEAGIICARREDGLKVTLPVAENVHRNSILDHTVAPARLPPGTAVEAQRVACALAEKLGVVGLLAVETFITEKGEVLVNEMAPRPHNCGHFSQDACSFSQFELFLRALCGLPLPEPKQARAAVMVNILGDDGQSLRGLPELLADPEAHLHLYGKTESRKGRKMGHFNVTGDDVASALSRAERLRRVLRWD